jgi:Flp pilus assembly pilin Flp
MAQCVRAQWVRCTIDIFTKLSAEVLIEYLMAVAARLRSMKTLLTRFILIESGSTAVEYALIASFMAVTVMTAVTIGNPLTTILNTIAAALTLAIL